MTIDFSDDITIGFDDFGQTITIDDVDLTGLYIRPFDQVNMLDGGIETTQPQVVVKTSDVPEVGHNSTVVVGSASFIVVGVQPTGIDLTVLSLIEAS
jgi:hypothetical protein